MVSLFSGSSGPVEASRSSTRLYPLQYFLKENGIQATTWGRPYGIFAVSQSGASGRPRPTSQHQPHLLGKARRRSGTAPTSILGVPGPSGPAGI